MLQRMMQGVIVLTIAATLSSPAAEVTVSLVTGPPGKAEALAEKQTLWKSPLGGWVVTTWPFALRVDDRPILEFRTTAQKLLDHSAADNLTPKSDKLDESLTHLDELTKTKPVDPRLFRLDRPSSAALDLAKGRHILHPFDMVFTVDADGALSTQDPRLRVNQEARRIEVVCHPVTVKTLAGDRSVPGSLRLICQSAALLGGLEILLAEFESKAPPLLGKPGDQAFRRLTLYLPASLPGKPYEVNGIRFDVDAEGRVALAEGRRDEEERFQTSTRARCPDGREIHLLQAVPKPGAAQLLGVRWFGGTAAVTLSADTQSVTGGAPCGSAYLTVPAAGARTVNLGGLTVRLPSTEARWPHGLLVWDVAGKACWMVETPSLAVRPGAEYLCRITPLTTGIPKLPAELPVRLAAEPGGAAGDEMKLSARGENLYAGVLPAVPGLWRLHAGAGSPLAGQVLGLALIAVNEPTAAISLYTFRNRGLFRRGDPVELLWTLKPGAGQPPPLLPVGLSGMGLEAPIGRIAPAKGDGKAMASGALRLDTAALAPGTYEAVVRAEGVVSYPLRFRICQRERRTDYEIYSYVFGEARPAGGTPVNAYYGGLNLANEPGLAPFRADVEATLDPAFAAYVTAPSGPVVEKFLQPLAEESALMALAGLGGRAVPSIPSMLHHEEWNPKHTLPEELTRLRRRLALFVQPRADVAGFGGVALNWYATLGGYWEESPALDGHQARRNAEAEKWIAARVEERVAEATGAAGAAPADAKRLEAVRAQAGVEFRSSVLPNAYAQYLADARVVLPELTAHSGIPSFWLGNAQSYPPRAYSSLTQRDSVDYTDYGISPWGNFRAPAFLAMGNPQGQKTQCSYMTGGRHSRIVTSFGAAGRGLDGISLTLDDLYAGGEDGALLRIFERFGSYFTALDPLPDVAVYFNGWPQQKSVILHDLARMRRPGMLLSQEDVLAGSLKDYRVLFLAALGDGEPPGVLDAFRAFEAKGGVILKDGLSAASLPGRDIGFAYEKDHIHNGWGLGGPNGEWEFAHLWGNFKDKREKLLTEAFANVPGIPITTPDSDVIISPLAGKESICCFIINQTLVPLSVEGKWRQHAVLPRQGTLLVEDGWHIRDLLAGSSPAVEKAPQGRRVTVDFTRAEGAIYLLTRREPVAMAMRTERTAQQTLRLTAWLADAQEQALADPMPFEVTLTGRDGALLFRKFAALGPERALDVPVPVLARGAKLELSVRDLVLGCTSMQPVAPAAEAALVADAGADIIGADHVAAFIAKRKGPVTVLLDEGQAAYRPAAEQLSALLRKSGRETRVVDQDPADIRPLPLRWKWNEEDLRVLDGARNGKPAWRVDMSPWIQDKNKRVLFDDPRCGYAEYGPRIWLEGDVVLFGTPETHVALADLQPYLRRLPSENYPAAGGFFVHYLWSPFQGGYDGLYLGCRDAAGAAAAVACLAGLAGGPVARPAAAAPKPETQPVVTWGRQPAPLENMIVGRFGTRILDAAFAPSGNRIFVTTDSYGESLFALNASGEILERRAALNRCGNNLWSRLGGRLRPVDDITTYMSLGDPSFQFLYSFERGWVGSSTNPPTGFTGRFQVKIAAATVLEDAAHARNYLGGARKMRALDTQGRLLWAYDDTTVRTATEDMLYPRSLFPRAVTTDGRYLLVSGFGIEHDCYGRGRAAKPSILGLDTASGKILWQRDGLLLNEGKVIASENRFLVVDDAGAFFRLRADAGGEAGRMRPVGGTDWILPISGRDELLIVENNAFDRLGPTACVYLRPLGDAPDRNLEVAGRVTDVVVATDGKTVTLCTERGRTTRFASDGKALWQADTPAGGLVRLSPDGQTVLVGARDGVLYWLSAKDGATLKAVDFNPFNVTTGERYVQQANSLGKVPADKALVVPPEPPAPSYLKSLDPKTVPFGPNLLPAERVRAALEATALPEGDPATPGYHGALDRTATFKLQVQAGKTYLVELLAAAKDPSKLTPQTRLEVAVTAARKTANLPYVAHLPIGRQMTRVRAAFRADEAGEVTLSLRAVLPRVTGEGKQAKTTYQEAATSEAGVIIGDLVVAAMAFAGRNLVLEAGPTVKSEALGRLECQVKPWSGGDSTLRQTPYACRKADLRCVDGVLANQETAWTTEATGLGVAYAEGRVRFKQPQAVAAIVVYEDNSGPVAAGTGVLETTAMHYGVYIREAKSGQWQRVGHVTDNTNLVNVFACPPVEINEIRYFWAGRNDAGRTDGVVRMAELEVYSTEEAGVLDLDR